MVDDRVARGIRCMRTTLAECADITLGQYAIESLLTMYRAAFVQTVLFNSGGWCNLKKQDVEKLRVLQMKYLKRILHAPQSTPNVVVMLELGVQPITSELHERQLNFLHHILSMEERDPVRLVYEQQKRYLYEKTWYREIKLLLITYKLEEVENEIRINRIKINIFELSTNT